MEPFIDGGFFELIIALGFITFVNFIFLRKYLLIIYSVIVLLSPALFLMVHSGDIFYLLLVFVFINSVLLVLLLWKQYKSSPGRALFETEKLRNWFHKKKKKYEPADDSVTSV